MKQYGVSVFVHIVLLVLFAIACYVLFIHNLWFSTLVAILLLAGTGIHLYVVQMKLAGMMTRLIESIRYNDMTQTFYPPLNNRVMTGMAQELSEALKVFRERLFEEEVKHQYYENLLNKVDTAVLVTDKSGHTEWMNLAAITHLGRNPQLPAEILKASTSDTRVVRIERNGTVLEMAASCTLFITQGKERLLISLKNIHSVLERNEMEAWQKLIRVLTHEIMNSITPIISLSETLSERGIPNQLTEKELQAMQTIHRRSKGLLGFVENYRRLTRIPEPVCTQVPARELFADLKKLFPAEIFHFRQPDASLTLWIDRTQIEQVLINLLKNAREACFRKSDARIEIELTQAAEGSILTVSDNGEGILPDVIDKIFVPFFTTKPSGSGIGLSLCKQIMNLHGGTISVRSEKGAGSCFTLVFPVLSPTSQTVYVGI